MRSRFVRPETRRLELTDGDWITVKARLTAGEKRAMFARMYHEVERQNGTLQPVVDLARISFVRLSAYLVDWSLEFPIRGVPVDVVEAALRNLEDDDLTELLAVLDAHEAREAEAFAALKKTSGAPASSPTLPSLVGAIGAMSG